MASGSRKSHAAHLGGSPRPRRNLNGQQKEAIRSYVESQANEKVVHLEKSASELVGPVRHDIWDVHCSASRWWVITQPTNLYSQDDFKSRDVALTFHVGLALRVSYGQERQVPVTVGAAELLPGSWRRWEQAFEAYDGGDEAEAFQAVGVRLRECLVSFIGETRMEALVPAGGAAPKGSDFKAWSELLANHLAPGESSARLRSYLKKIALENWEYVNWLTHAKGAVRIDAEIALKAVEHLLGVFTAARLRHLSIPRRCDVCGSYDVRGPSCVHCGWVDQSYRAPEGRPWSKRERARRLAEPCVPSSDISTFLGPRDFITHEERDAGTAPTKSAETRPRGPRARRVAKRG